MVDRVMIVVAAGHASRFGSDKLLTPLDGEPLVAHTVAAVRPHVEMCILVCREDQLPELRGLDLDVVLVPGGPSRTASEMAGLSAIGEPAGLIGIHDGARPSVTAELIEGLYQAAAEHGGAIPVVAPSRPLVHRADLTPARGVSVAQTPQVFRGEPLLAAYVEAARIEYEGQDTAEIVQKFSKLGIRAVPGETGNIKVTHPGDLQRLSRPSEASRSEAR